MEIQSEQAFEFLIQHLGKIPSSIQRYSLVALRYAHLYLPDVVAGFWQARLSGTSTVALSDEHYTVFYDAAWELARIGVLRPGRVAPRNMETANDFGDHWSITLPANWESDYWSWYEGWGEKCILQPLSRATEAAP